MDTITLTELIRVYEAGMLGLQENDAHHTNNDSRGFLATIAGAILFANPVLQAQAFVFRGGVNNSLVTAAVCAAEGTCTLEENGGFSPNKAYYGHNDPGDGYGNSGYFSTSPERSGINPETRIDSLNQSQFKSLYNGFKKIEEQAREAGMALSLEEKLNAIDLLNQSPAAALGWDDQKSTGMGFIYHLKETRNKHSGKKNNGTAAGSAIIQARIEAFKNIQGAYEHNFTDEEQLSQDQKRRAATVREVLVSRGYEGAEHLTVLEVDVWRKEREKQQILNLNNGVALQP